MSNLAVLAALRGAGNRGGNRDERGMEGGGGGARNSEMNYGRYNGPYSGGDEMRYEGGRNEGGGRMAYQRMEGDRMGYGRMEGGRMEGGRMEYGRMGGEPYERQESHWPSPYMPPIGRPYPRRNGPEEEEDEEPEMMGENITPIDAYRSIGFGEARRGQPRWQNGRFKRRSAEMHYGEEEPQQMRFGGVVGVSQEGGGQHAKLTKSQAEEWVESMENDNDQRPKGGMYSWEVAKEWAQKVGIQPVGQRMIDFYAAMNAMFSDYSAVAAKYKVDTPEFFAHMAKAFIDDPDAVKNKTAMYYKCIVEK